MLAAAFLLAWGGGAARAQEGAREDRDERLERLEREVETLKAEREAERARAAAAPTATAAQGGLSALALGEKFEKRFGKDALLTWKNGFWLSFLDENEPDPEKKVIHSLHVGGLVQFDGRFFFDAEHPQDNTFLVRRARLKGEGTLFRYFDYVVEGEFANDKGELRDGYVNMRFVPFLQLRGGNFKPPFMRELITSDKYLDFLERPLAFGTLAVDRDLGVMVHGDVDFANYQLALMNGKGSNLRDDNDDKDVLVRLGITPFKPGKGLLEDVEIAGSYTYGHEKNFVPTFATYAGTTFLSLSTVPGGVQRGPRSRVGAELTVPVGPFKLQAEYMYMRAENLPLAADQDENVEVQNWYVDLMFMITGERRRVNRPVVPEKNLDPIEGGFGAWEVGLRFEQLTTDERLRRSTSVPGTNETDILMFGTNWYWNPLMKLTFNYYHAWFDEDIVVSAGGSKKRMDNEDVVMVRWQLEF